MNVLLLSGVLICVAAFGLIAAGIALLVSGETSRTTDAILLLVAGGIVEPFGVLLALRGIQLSRGGAVPVPPNLAGEKTLYHDRLVYVNPDGIWFPAYYFPWGGKFLRFDEVEQIECRPPTIANGKWRLWGGDLRTWFPLDGQRSSRPVIFHAVRKNHRLRIGFTVEHSDRFRTTLRDRVRFVN